MSSERKNIDILEHITNYCEQIQSTITFFGDSFETFENDFIYRNACTLCLLQIGELTSHLSDDFKNCCPEVPWNKIKGLRNVVAHDYGSLNIEKLWNTLKKSVPDLYSNCKSIVNQYYLLNQQAVDEESHEDGGELEY